MSLAVEELFSRFQSELDYIIIIQFLVKNSNFKKKMQFYFLFSVPLPS